MDVDEAQLMELLHTNSEVGTNPQDTVNGACSLGSDAQVVENLTLDQLERLTADGNPVIALGQMWRSEREFDRPLEDVWDNGHYVVVLGVDKDYYYLQIPTFKWARFRPAEELRGPLASGHGREFEKNPKLIHLGIVVRGKRPAKPKVDFSPDVPELDFSKFGSLNSL